jgi:hypothetical protein
VVQEPEVEPGLDRERDDHHRQEDRRRNPAPDVQRKFRKNVS